MTRDRSVLVRLRASVSEFTGPMKQAEKSVRDVIGSTQDVGRSGDGVMSRMAQHARDNRQAWDQVGGALTVYGAAVTGVGAAVLGVGISYNTLRQRSVAALTTLTGSAEAANAQMDKLDEFASTSPFARDVFIRAQQQLIGFGMAAEDVVPTLDAIQNAVAATGGTNEDIAELTRIIAQVGAAGKITAEDLNQFGQRGVDAATLIGSQMGKTGQQIRQEITSGTLDADAAIAALVTGMDERFGGAAENVKGTMDGAVDRVKAAFRDISASFASVLVDPEGGGLLVDGLNKLADGLRAFEDLPTPIRNTALALGLISGPAALAAGGFLLLAPRAVETWDALGRMGSLGTRTQDFLKGIARHAPTAAKGLGLVAAGYVAIKAVGEIATRDIPEIPGIESLTAGILDLREAGDPDALNAIFAEFQSGQGKVTDFASAADLLVNPDWRDNIQGFGDSLFGLEQEADKSRETFEQLGSVLAQMVTDGDIDGARAAFEQLYGMVDQTRISEEEFIALFPAYSEALKGVDNEARAAAEGVDELSGAFVRIDPSILQGKVAEIRAANAEILQSFLDLSAGINDEELSLDGWIAQLEEQINAAANYADNIATIRGAGVNEAFVEALMAEGEAGAMRAQQIADRLVGGDTALRDQLNTIGAEAAGEGGLMGGAQATLDSSHPLKMRVEAQAEAQQIADEKARLNDIFYRDPATVPVEADAADAEQSVHDLVLWAAEQTGIVGLDADDTDAIMKIDQWNALANNTEGLPTLNADPALAEVQLAAWLHDANIARATSTLDADASPARGEFDVWYRKADTATATSTLDANNSPAIGANNAWERDGNNSSATATLSANTSRAYSALWAFARAAANTSVSIGLSASGGHAAGGYTGFGGKYEERGIVHASEFVHTKENTSKPGMLGFHYDLWASNDLDAAYARYKMRGYANGGLVGGSPSWAGVRYASASSSPDVSALASQVASLSRAVASIPEAMSGWQPVVRLGDREFYGQMVRVGDKYQGRTL